MLRRVVREPLVHFLGIGILVFVAYRSGGASSRAPDDALIAITQPQVELLVEQFEAAWRRAPSDAEVAALVEDLIREEVYYREALALGLDRDDAVIRRRLRQKMEFLGEGAAASVAPDQGALEAHFATHTERFAEPPRVTFRQATLEDAGQIEAVWAALAGGADPSAVGRGGLLPEAMETAGVAAVDGVFGPGFFEKIAALPQGGWEGPVQSSFGYHLVEIISFFPATVRPFEAVRDAVEQDWRRANAEAIRDAQFEALRQGYRVVLPEPLK